MAYGYRGHGSIHAVMHFAASRSPECNFASASSSQIAHRLQVTFARATRWIVSAASSVA